MVGRVCSLAIEQALRDGARFAQATRRRTGDAELLRNVVD